MTGRCGLGDGVSREWVEEGQVGGCMGKQWPGDRRLDQGGWNATENSWPESQETWVQVQPCCLLTPRPVESWAWLVASLCLCFLIFRFFCFIVAFISLHRTLSAPHPNFSIAVPHEQNIREGRASSQEPSEPGTEHENPARQSTVHDSVSPSAPGVFAKNADSRVPAPKLPLPVLWSRPKTLQV